METFFLVKNYEYLEFLIFISISTRDDYAHKANTARVNNTTEHIVNININIIIILHRRIILYAALTAIAMYNSFGFVKINNIRLATLMAVKSYVYIFAFITIGRKNIIRAR